MSLLETFGRSTFDPAPAPDLEPGRVLAVHRTNLSVMTESGLRQAELTGRLRFTAETEDDFPVTGDWVWVRALDDLAMVSEVQARQGVLRRRRPGTSSGLQIMASWVDVALLVHGCNLPVNVRRLERFAAAVRDGGIEPVVVLSKVDLLDDEERKESIAQCAHIGPVVAASSEVSGGFLEVQGLLEAGRTFVLIGPSGAGKTTLLNGLLGSETFATGAVRDVDGKGRHTTTRRELVQLPSGALLIDTPGVREMGMTDMQGGIEDTFDEIAVLAETCRFADCRHQEEVGCAVLAAVETGDLAAETLAAYHKLEREAAHFERSIAERRRRDRGFGKMVREVMKHKKDRR
ncbi:MAG: ribosome small subunit-dependent GTPase A [Rhodothermales bacterium]|nr:ribosome small subunit-dependent GTPase A [Rhodothermales bacterium]MBO6780525.1 ribosome small subunit-dependent GTPase A [Rhodothermales bacterium]